MQIIDERHVIDRMPVERIEYRIERHRVQEFVYGFDNFRAVVACGTLFYIQRAGNKVILHVDDEKGALWPRAYLDPPVPAYLSYKLHPIFFSSTFLIILIFCAGKV